MLDRPSVVLVALRRNTYFDSLTLLQVSSKVTALPGVLDAALVMATPLNQEVLRTAGLLADEAAAAGPNDLVLAVRGTGDAAAEAALSDAERLLADRGRPSDGQAAEEPPRSIRGAHRRLPGANVALISVPGPFAAAEAHQALSDGLHVFLFSANVPLADEVALKRRASQAGLLVMGPDCGTAIINGVGLGFANAVRRGHIGLVGASGTGLQEITTLLHQAGQGVSHAIGTGGRDLHADVGGITTLQALDLLGADPETASIVLVSKPADPAVAERVLRAAAKTGKPVLACLLGADLVAPHGVRLATTLAEAAHLAGGRAASPASGAPLASTQAELARPAAAQHPAPAAALRPPSSVLSPGGVRGLFCGGTLADEADRILDGVPHTTVDLGGERYTQGRLHPMIDPTLRNQAILDAASGSAVAVLLLDVILGYGAHPDPAGVVAPVIRQAIERAAAAGRWLPVLVHLLGTDLDPQAFAAQATTLRESGALLFGSNAAAAEAARRLVAERAG